jgi:urease accessory protein
MPTSISVQRAAGAVRLDMIGDTLVPREIGRSAAGARVALVAGGALLLGGDRVDVDIVVGAGCVLELQDIGGTVAYDADRRTSEWHTTITLEEGATLAWSTWPFVVASGAYVLRSLSIDLAPGARACLRDTLVLGREGEVGGAARLRTDARLDGRPLFAEELDVDGERPAPGVLGANRVLDSILFLGARPDASLSAAAASSGHGALHLDGPGELVRSLGTAAHSSSLDATWGAYERELLRGSLHPAR